MGLGSFGAWELGWACGNPARIGSRRQGVLIKESRSTGNAISLRFTLVCVDLLRYSAPMTPTTSRRGSKTPNRRADTDRRAFLSRHAVLVILSDMGRDFWLSGRLLSRVAVEINGQLRKIQIRSYRRGSNPPLSPGFHIMAIVFPDSHVDFTPPPDQWATAVDGFSGE